MKKIKRSELDNKKMSGAIVRITKKKEIEKEEDDSKLVDAVRMIAHHTQEIYMTLNKEEKEKRIRFTIVRDENDLAKYIDVAEL